MFKLFIERKREINLSANKIWKYWFTTYLFHWENILMWEIRLPLSLASTDGQILGQAVNTKLFVPTFSYYEVSVLFTLCEIWLQLVSSYLTSTCILACTCTCTRIRTRHKTSTIQKKYKRFLRRYM